METVNERLKLKKIEFNVQKEFVAELIALTDSTYSKRFAYTQASFSSSLFSKKNLGNVGSGKNFYPSAKAQTFEYPKNSQLSGTSNVSQANFPIRSLSIENGLPNNKILSSYYGENRTVWIGYLSGEVSKINGNDIVNFNARQHFPTSAIMGITEYEGTLILLTFGEGLFMVRDNQILHFGKENGFPSDHLHNACFDGQNNLWISTYNGGLIKMTKNGFIHFNAEGKIPAITDNICYDQKSESILFSDSENNVYSIDKNGNYFKWNLPETVLNKDIKHMVTGRNVALLFGENILLTLKNNTWRKQTFPISSDLSYLFEAASGNIWAASERGDVLISNNGFWSCISVESGMHSQSIRTMIQDDFKNIWSGTIGSGMNLVTATNFRSILTEKDDNFHTNAKVFKADDGNLLMTAEDGFLEFYDGLIAKEYKHPELVGINGVYKQKGQYYFTKYGGFYQLSGDSLFRYKLPENKGDGFYSFLNVGKGLGDNINFCNYNYSLTQLNPEKNSLSHFSKFQDIGLVSNFFVDDKNRTWLSTPGGGIVYIKDGYQNTLKGNVGLINDITQGNAGEVFFASSIGVFKLDKNNDLFEVILEDHNGNLDIQSIFYSSLDSSLWLGCSKQLYKMELGNSTYKRFNSDQGISGISYEKNSAVSVDDKIYWTTNKALIQYTPFDFDKIRGSPNLFVKSIEIDHHFYDYYDSKNQTLEAFTYTGVKQGIPQNLNLSSSIKSISLFVGTDEIKGTDPTQYYYKFDSEMEWQGPVANNEITIPIKKGGSFSVAIKALANNHFWTESLNFTYKVTIPFYKTSWFIIALFSLFLLVAGIFIYNRSKFNVSITRSFSDYASFLNRTRFLAYTIAFLLPLVEFFLAVQLKLIPENWLAISVLACLGPAYIIMSYIKSVPRNILEIGAITISSALTMFTLLRVTSSDFNPLITLELIVIIAFCTILFESIKHFIVYAAVNTVIVIYSLTIISFSNTDHILFLTGITLISVFSFFYHYFQVYKVTNLNFSSHLLENYENFVLVVNKDNDIIYANEYTYKQFGFKESDLTSLKWFELIQFHPRAEKLILERMRNSFESGVPPKSGKNFFKKIGSYVEWNYQFTEENTLLCIGNDITEIHEKDVRLNTLYSAMNKINTGVFITDTDNLVEWCNPFVSELFEVSEKDIIGKQPSKIFPVPDFFKEKYEAIVANGTPDDTKVELAHELEGERVIWLLLSQSTLTDQYGKATKKLEIITDITEQKAKEVEFKKLSIISESTQSPVFLCDTNLVINWCNEALLEAFKYSKEEVLNNVPGKLFIGNETDPEFVKVVNTKTQLDESFTVKIKLRDKNGIHDWYKLIIDPLHDANGKKVQFVCIMQPIGELISIQDQLQEKNKYILAGINYAERIQKSQLSDLSVLNALFPESFLFYMPKDIVSGDFYYFYRTAEKLIIAVADCTGHGVPGAMMTFVGNAAFEHAIVHKQLTEPGEILDAVDEYVKNALSSNRNDVNDGMDVILLAIDTKELKFEFAGARRPLMMKSFSSEEVTVSKTDQSSIGELTKGFSGYTTGVVDYSEGVDLYLFSDGITDQFGTLDRAIKEPKKFSQKRLTAFVQETHALSKLEQGEKFAQVMNTWTEYGQIEQTDDMILLSLKLNKKRNIGSKLI